MSQFFEDSDIHQHHAAEDPPLPRVIQLELTAECNLRCVFCPLQSEARERAPHERRIELADLQTTLRPLLAHAYEVELTGFGEMFCHPQLLEALRFLKDLGLTVNATSNGTQWRADELETIVDEGLVDLLCVSLDAGAAETYARLRVGGDFHRVGENLLLLNSLKTKLGKTRPALHLSFISLVDNLHELPEVVRLASRVGASCVIVQGLFENEQTQNRGSAHSPDEPQVFADAAALAAQENVALEFWYQNKNAIGESDAVRKVQVTAPGDANRAMVKDCSYPWERVFVKSNLDVQVCATLWEKLVLGNLRRQSMEEIWHGEPYRRLRRRLAGTRPPDECLTCPTKSWKLASKDDELDDRVIFGSRLSRQLGRGFYEPERLADGRAFRWSAGRCTFFLRNAGRPFLDCELYTHPRMPTSLITLRVNNMVVDVFRHDQVGGAPLRFVLPFFPEPVLRVDLDFDRPFTPAEVGDGASRRPLGAMMVQAALIGNTAQLAERIRVGKNCDDHVGRGFYPREESMKQPLRWTSDRASFALARGCGDHLEIELWTPGKPQGQRVEVLVDHEAQALITMPDRPGRVLVRAPVGEPKPWHVVTLCCETLWAPGGADTRQLGVLFAGARTVRRAAIRWWRRGR